MPPELYSPVPLQQSSIAAMLKRIIALSPWKDRTKLARVLDFERMIWDSAVMQTTVAGSDCWKIAEQFSWVGVNPPTADHVTELIDAYEAALFIEVRKQNHPDMSG